MKMTQYLRSTGLLEAYEKLLTSMYTNGWPGDRSIYDYSAEEILRYGSKFKQEYKGVIGKEFEKKARAILDTKDEEDVKEPTPKNIISVRRDPIELNSKNSLDLNIFDKPRVQLARSSKEGAKLRETAKENEFLQLDLTKPQKKEIIMSDDPDFTLDKDYYKSEFQKPPEQDEDLLKMSMKSGHKDLDADPVINTSSHLNSSYDKNEAFDDTQRRSQLDGIINNSQEDGVNIGGPDMNGTQSSRGGMDNTQEEGYNANQRMESDNGDDKLDDSKQRIDTQNSVDKNIDEGEHDHKSSHSRTPVSKKSLDKSRESNQNQNNDK